MKEESLFYILQILQMRELRLSKSCSPKVTDLVRGRFGFKDRQCDAQGLTTKIPTSSWGHRHVASSLIILCDCLLLILLLIPVPI